MTIFRIQKKDNYVVLDKGFLNDTSLSWQAKGLLAYMLSLPNDWRFSVVDLAQRSKSGRDATSSVIKELSNAGYIRKQQIRAEQGKFGKTELLVYETPQNPPFTENPLTVKPETEKPQTDKPSTENPSLLSNNKLNNNLLINNNDEDKVTTAYAAENKKSKPNPFKFYEENGFGGISSHVANKVNIWIDDLNEELVVHAMELAAENNVLKWNYVETILKDWYNKKFNSISDVEADRLRFEAQKNQKQNPSYRGKPTGRQEMVPEWFKNRNNKNAQAAPVEQPQQEDGTDFEAARQKVLQKIRKNTEV